MLSAKRRDMAGDHFGRNRKAKIATSRRFNHDWLRRSACKAAAVAAAIFLSLGTDQQTHAQTVNFTVIHSFSGTDGTYPESELVRDASGNLYGTTSHGGDPGCYSGCGTVFKIDPFGKEAILHYFTGGTDGANPYAGLVRDTSGNLYGTTSSGGTSNDGTVFKIDAVGKESVLHSFNGADGALPSAGLVLDASGNLYGTTAEGGSSACDGVGCGTVFMINSSGNFTIVHYFTGGTDGTRPLAGLVIDSSGNLYGTTEGGGSGCYGYGCGTVFKIDAEGNESVLHSFSYDNNGTDGMLPHAGLVLDSSGNLYGTTFVGGSMGSGTVFKIDAEGDESVLHSLNGLADGAYPIAGLTIDAAGNLYGAATNGGSAGAGNVFRVDPSGNETVIHNFTGGADGASPSAGLVLDASGNLYGAASFGGPAGYGTVFKISFPVPFSSFSAKLNIVAGPPPGFQLQAFFTPGTGASAIDPVADGMTLTVGTYTVTIPPSSFHQTRKGWWVYEGKINGVSLDVRISQRGVNPYELQFEASGVDLTSLTNPVTIRLALGNNYGTTQANQ